MINYDLPPSKLFQGISADEMQSMQKCLSAVSKRYEKGDYILRMGDVITSIGLIVRGSVQIKKEDYWGDSQILGIAAAGQLFGESYACSQGEPLMVHAVAAEESEILFLDMKRILTMCASSCVFHSRLIHNLLSIISDKNLMLTRKIEHISKKTIREKVLSYLSYLAGREGSSTFLIPFNRQQFADYLAVDRSALSAELSKMQKEKIISYRKNCFTIY